MADLHYETECSKLSCAGCDALESQIANLEVALDTSRTVGMALGILVERYKISPEAAFDMLKTVSQHSHRKVRDLASDLVFTGEFHATPMPRSACPKLPDDRTTTTRHRSAESRFPRSRVGLRDVTSIAPE